MKRLARTPEPDELSEFKAANPASTWDQMKSDAEGRTAYDAIRRNLIQGQKGLCAYCEIGIHENDSLRCRVEHFHPKSDLTAAYNWALEWQNMLAVCMGGSQRWLTKPHTLEPLQENLSCDAYKDMMIQTGSLEEKCEGWIFDPYLLPDFPRLFSLEKSTGKLNPDEIQCAAVTIFGNKHPTTQLLVKHTIDMLNLNCDRLCEARLKVLWDIEHQKKKLRDQGADPNSSLANLAERYFRRQWPGFFTTIRFCLGAAAEQYLTAIGFQG